MANQVPRNVQRVEESDAIRLQAEFTRFINEYEDSSGEKIYRQKAAELVQPERNTLRVDMDHVHSHSTYLASTINLQYYRMMPYMSEALQLIVVECCDDVGDRARLQMKQFYIAFHNLVYKNKMRQLTSAKVGSLLRISGQIVRTHTVHPELALGTFECEDCGVATKNVEQEFRYTQPSKCANPQCANRNRFKLNVDESVFVDFQKIRIQEIQAELPRGAIPRSLDVIIRGEMVETVQPGDRCELVGTLIAIPDVAQLSTPGIRAEASSGGRQTGEGHGGISGLKALGVRELNYRLAFLSCYVSSLNITFGGKDFSHDEIDHIELWKLMEKEEQQQLKNMSEDKNIAYNLIQSLFPNIYGNDEVKLGVLLMLFGGVCKRSKSEGTTLRGDINICLVGDPSTAKSQVLKRVEEFCPRAIYTSGKASSAAGLTAAVVKDEESFEFVIEAGALMLADRGVCCIDEFDKMAQHDQVAIHEAMEQQTISITKAGVKATLNARASILAAANPIGGRYDRSRPLKQNVSLTAPIMSRFDLFFVLIDECDEVVDLSIARRILDNHSSLSNKTKHTTKYTTEEIHKYITFAKCFRPKLSEEAAAALVSSYKELRIKDSNSYSSSWRITVRQLESLVRLSEALARMYCCSQVTAAHVKQATSLLTKSIIRVDQPDISLDGEDEMELGEGEEEITPNKENQLPSSGKTEASKMRIRYELYKKLSEMIVRRVRNAEERLGEQFEGVRVGEIVTWYLEMMESELDSEEAALEQKSICQKVIERLLHDEKILIQLDDKEDFSVVVHPNYVLPDED